MFGYTLPALLLALIILMVVGAYSWYNLNRMRQFKEDFYRQSIENQIIKLEKSLVETSQRFDSVNHLLIEAQQAQAKSRNLNNVSEFSFLESLGINPYIKKDDRLVFVLMPFNSQFDDTYKLISNTVQELGLKCSRGDSDQRSSSILTYIIEEMMRSELIIADITGRNSNVFYELGIAHAMNKNVLIIANNSYDIPFDVSSVRVLIYKNYDDLASKLRSWLFNGYRPAGKV